MYSLPHSSQRALKRQSIAGREVKASVSARGILCLKNRFFRMWNQWFLQGTTQKYRLSSHMRVASVVTRAGRDFSAVNDSKSSQTIEIVFVVAGCDVPGQKSHPAIR